MISSITCWPTGFDYPLFRKDLGQLRREVDEVLICFTKHGNYDLSGWVRDHVKHSTFFDEPADDHTQDWRSRATNLMLDNAKGDWILSIEQDFLITDYMYFFAKIRMVMDKCDVITFPEDQRYHPAFLLVRTDLLNKTKRDFSVMGDGRDHFHQITKELKGLEARTIYLEDVGLKQGLDWVHMQGLTDNYFAPKPYFKLPEFHRYNQDCKTIKPMSDYWKEEMIRCSNTQR
jgi:hypothetical protein